MQMPILTTKLYSPPPRPERVARPRLLARLTEGQRRKLTLVSAPAGFGKTTLVSEWLQDTETKTNRVAWLSLDEADDDLPRFLTYLVAALQQIDPDLGQPVQSLLRAPEPQPPEALMTTLINDLAVLPDRTVLVLDDYHVISTPSIHTALTFLVDHLPPALHLVITSRADPPLPLARLRARGQLIELRSTDLRFTTTEATAFLNHLMGLDLPPPDVTALAERTEGWVAGLQLAALSLRSSPNRTAFIDAFTGDDRYIIDYLMDEVLSHQPPPIQQFLLQTSILERLCGPLCDRVIDRTENQPSGQSILEQLEQANLFLIPLDNRREWYRYHHLFGDLLRHRASLELGQAALADLHRQAGAWYEAAGSITEALPHLLAAQDFDYAARLIEAERTTLLTQGAVTALERWIKTLPPDLVARRPRLLLTAAWNHLKLAHIDRLEARLDQAEVVLAKPDTAEKDLNRTEERQALMGEALALRALLHLFQGRPDQTITLSEQALALLPADNLLVRGHVNLNFGYANRTLGHVAAARHAFAEAYRQHQAAHNLFDAELALINLAELHERCGDLQQAADVYQQALGLADNNRGHALDALGITQVSYGKLLYQWQRLDEAEHYLESALRAIERIGLIKKGIIAGKIALAFVRQAQGEAEAVRALLSELPALARTEHPALMTWLEAAQIPLWLRQNNLPAAVRWLTTNPPPTKAPFSEFTETIFFSFIRVRLAQVRVNDADDLVDVFELIDKWLHEVYDLGWIGRAIELLLLQALGFAARHETEAAFTTLEKALILAEPGGYVRLFVDEGEPLAVLLRAAVARHITPGYVTRLLAACGDEAATPTADPLPQPLIDPLSNRELEILHLIAEGLTNQQIADRLFIVLGTVKKHTSNIYGKLGVSRRTHAIAKARALGILVE